MADDPTKGRESGKKHSPGRQQRLLEENLPAARPDKSGALETTAPTESEANGKGGQAAGKSLEGEDPLCRVEGQGPNPGARPNLLLRRVSSDSRTSGRGTLEGSTPPEPSSSQEDSGPELTSLGAAPVGPGHPPRPPGPSREGSSGAESWGTGPDRDGVPWEELGSLKTRGDSVESDTSRGTGGSSCSTSGGSGCQQPPVLVVVRPERQLLTAEDIQEQPVSHADVADHSRILEIIQDLLRFRVSDRVEWMPPDMLQTYPLPGDENDFEGRYDEDACACEVDAASQGTAVEPCGQLEGSDQPPPDRQRSPRAGQCSPPLAQAGQQGCSGRSAHYEAPPGGQGQGTLATSTGIYPSRQRIRDTLAVFAKDLTAAFTTPYSLMSDHVDRVACLNLLQLYRHCRASSGEVFDLTDETFREAYQRWKSRMIPIVPPGCFGLPFSEVWIQVMAIPWEPYGLRFWKVRYALMAKTFPSYTYYHLAREMVVFLDLLSRGRRLCAP